MGSIRRTALFKAYLAMVVLDICSIDVNGQRIEPDRESAAAAKVTIVAANDKGENEPASVADEFSGKWIYRSFISQPTLSDEKKPLELLLFGQGNLELNMKRAGSVTGTLGGDGWQLNLKGTTQAGDPPTIAFQGKGTISGEQWVYDYIGYAVPKWTNGIDQRPGIVGTIVRTVPHSKGKAPAGYVAQWIAVRQIDEGEVRQLEHGWAEAVKTNNAEKINRFFADYFSFVGPNGNPQTREEHLDDFRSGKLKVTSLRIEMIDVVVHDTTATATVRAAVEGSYDGHDITGDYEFHDTWTLVQGRLRAVVRKQTRVNSDGSAATDKIGRPMNNVAQDPAFSPSNAWSYHSSIGSFASATAGKKSVILFVKGSFCPHCMSQIEIMANELTGRDVNVFVVSASTEDDLRDFPRALYRLVADPKLDLFKAYGAFDGEAKHATIVLDEDGNELFRDVDNEPLLDTAPVIRAIASSSGLSTASVK